MTKIIFLVLDGDCQECGTGNILKAFEKSLDAETFVNAHSKREYLIVLSVEMGE